MAFYWIESQLPELKHLTPQLRSEIVEAAIFSIPITKRNLGYSGAFLFSIVGFGFACSMVIGGWVLLGWMPLSVFAINAFFMNLARPQMRKLLADVAAQSEQAEFRM